jgi:hypothetical protein
MINSVEVGFGQRTAWVPALAVRAIAASSSGRRPHVRFNSGMRTMVEQCHNARRLSALFAAYFIDSIFDN